MAKRSVDSTPPRGNSSGNSSSEAVPLPEPTVTFGRRRRRRSSFRTRHPSTASASSPTQASQLRRGCIIGRPRPQGVRSQVSEPTVSSSEVAQAQASSASASPRSQATRVNRSTPPRLIQRWRSQPVGEQFQVALVPSQLTRLTRRRSVGTRRPQSAQAALVPSSVQVPSQAPRSTRRRIARTQRPQSARAVSPTGEARAESVPSPAPRMRRPSTVIPRPPGPIYWADLLRPVATPPPDPTVRASVPEPPHWIAIRQRMARYHRPRRSRRSETSSRAPALAQIPQQGSGLTNQHNVSARHPQSVPERIPSQVAVPSFGSEVAAIPAQATRATNQRNVGPRRSQSSARAPAVSSRESTRARIQAQPLIFGPVPSLPLALPPTLSSTLSPILPLAMPPAMPPAMPRMGVRSARPFGRVQPAPAPRNRPVMAPVPVAPLAGLIVLDLGTVTLEPVTASRGRNAAVRRMPARLVARAGHSAPALPHPNENREDRHGPNGSSPFPRNNGNQPLQ